MSKLTGFTSTINSNNINKFLAGDDTDSIIIGGTSRHIFTLPFNYSTVVTSGEIIYRQKLSEIMRLPIRPDMVKENIVGSLITAELLPEMTSLFSKSLMDTFCQIRLVLKDGSILYDDPHKLRVVAPLAMREDSESGEDLKNLTIEDCSYMMFFELSNIEFLNLLRHHVIVLSRKDFNIENNFFEFDLVKVKIKLADTEYRLNMIKNNPENSFGTLVISQEDDLYELLISLVITENDAKLIIRCANIY